MMATSTGLNKIRRFTGKISVGSYLNMIWYIM